MEVTTYHWNKKVCFRQYEGQCQPQQAYVELNPEDGTLSASYNPEIGNAVPFRVYHKRCLRFSIPCELRGKAINKLLREILPLARIVEGGYYTEWDGNNTVGRYNEFAISAIERIEALCREIDYSYYL